MNSISIRTAAVFLALFLAITACPDFGWTEEESEKPSNSLLVLNVEVLDVEELEGADAGANFYVRDLASGQRMRFYAHPYRTTIYMGGAVQSAADVLGGSKATIIYRSASGENLPELLYVSVTSSYVHD